MLSKIFSFKYPILILVLSIFLSIGIFLVKDNSVFGGSCNDFQRVTRCVAPSGNFPTTCPSSSCHFSTSWSGIQVTCSQYKYQDVIITSSGCDTRQDTEICSGVIFSSVYAQSEISNGCNQTVTNTSLESYCGDGFCTGNEQYNSCSPDCMIGGGSTYTPSPSGAYDQDSLVYTINPYTRTLTRGGGVTLYNVEVYGSGIYSGSVTGTLSVTNCPTGATCTFLGDSSVVFSSSNSDTYVTKVLQVTTTASTPVNTYSFNVNLNFLAFSKQKQAFLIVQDYTIDPTLYIDYPSNGATVSGVLNVLGWAIDNQYTVEGPISSKKVYVDNVLVGNATSYSRQDVCSVYPSRSGCPNVGFGYTLDTTTLTNGSHTLKFEITDSDTVPKKVSETRSITVNNSSSGTIQGYKVKSTNFSTSDVPPASQTVTLNGSSSSTANPFSFANISLGTNNTVSVNVPSGWGIGYTICYGNTTCHSNTPTSGSSVVVNIPSNLPSGQRYADLWWHFTPPVNTPPTITLLGSNPMTVSKGNAFTDPGATAFDAEDGNLTSAIVPTGTVNTATVGTYTRTYTVKDSKDVTVSVTRTVNVVNPNSFSLTVTRSTGGNVNSLDGFINCGTTCSAVYSQNTNVTLNAVPLNAQWIFVGWSGACSGTSLTCVVTMNASKTASAEFRPRPFDYREF